MPFVLSFGLVIASIILSWIAAIVMGGFKIGSLEKRIALLVKQEELPSFLEQLQRRIAELRFQTGPAPGQFLQGGASFDDGLSSFTHAKTKKELIFVMHNDGQSDVRVELTLRFLDPIVGDSGESAYRDAVLDYVSGRTMTMQVVPNRSFAALSSFVGGVFAWAALFALIALHFEPSWLPILILGLTEATTGVAAILAIRDKPGELTGTGLAIAGIAASISAVMLAGALAILKAL